MGSAQLDTLAATDQALAPREQACGAAHMPAAEEMAGVRQQAAERLAAHRLRRARTQAVQVQGRLEPAQTEPACKEVERIDVPRHKAASAVLERFAHTPSYRAVLAAEAQRAIEEAEAAAEVAARNAEAVAQAHQHLLVELSRYDEPVAFTPETAIVLGESPRVAEDAPELPKTVNAPAAPRASRAATGLTVRLYEDAGRTRPAATASVGTRNRSVAAMLDSDEALAIAEALDDEILFRKAPVFEEYAPQEEAVPLPANLLEFPRQLVAPKKARPRLAEGPLRDEANPQLRIFEVAATHPLLAADAPAPATFWTDSIWLDAHIPGEHVPLPEFPTAVLPSLLPPQVAPLHLRAMSAAVDALLVLSGFVAFTAASAHFAGAGLLATAPVLLSGAAAAVLAVLYFLYQGLFFSLTDATPGMRYARIGLCTFTDENPSRSAMRRRILAQIIAVCPLGMGILWMLLDDDRLGWHDRISRMYQRAY
jgi:uncharacterized RDD family membrane protein YckC